MKTEKKAMGHFIFICLYSLTALFGSEVSAQSQKKHKNPAQKPLPQTITPTPLKQPNPLDHVFKTAQPGQNLEEIVQIMDDEPQRSSEDNPSSFQLKTLPSTSSRDVAFVNEQVDEEDEDEGENTPSQGRKAVPKKQNSLVPLIQDSFFEKERVRRDLDVYIDETTKKELSLEGEEIKEDLGGVEVRWTQQE